MAVHVPARFSEEIAIHLIRNFAPDPRPGTPLLLGIHGAPGEGKTFQTELVLQSAGVEALLISGGQLESANAGEPAETIRSSYREASAMIGRGQPTVLILNDADAALGSWGSMTQYTVNTQNVVTPLMHLADYPNVVEGNQTYRVPVILTGNDLGRLYGPLCRHGRMEMFRWEPTAEERADAVATIFPTLDRAAVLQLCSEFPDQPIAFWRSIQQRHERDHLVGIIRRQSLADVIRVLCSGRKLTQTLDLLDAGRVRHLIAASTANEPVNHLADTGHRRSPQWQ